MHARPAIGILARMPELRWARGRTLVLLAALVVALAACDSTSTPSAAPATPTPAEETCVGERLEQSGIDGRVVDADGNPLGDIFILIETGMGFRGDTRTGDDGIFTAPGVTGEFTISTIDVDYESDPQRVTVACGETVEVEIVMSLAGE
jgi:Carboxypeptidase regulatory-like domain